MIAGREHDRWTTKWRELGALFGTRKRQRYILSRKRDLGLLLGKLVALDTKPRTS